MNIKIRIIETKAFSKKITGLLAQHSLLLDDYNALKKDLAVNPEKGDILTGTGGVRKIRLKSASKGKGGGFPGMLFLLCPDKRYLPPPCFSEE